MLPWLFGLVDPATDLMVQVTRGGGKLRRIAPIELKLDVEEILAEQYVNHSGMW